MLLEKIPTEQLIIRAMKNLQNHLSKKKNYIGNKIQEAKSLQFACI